MATNTNLRVKKVFHEIDSNPSIKQKPDAIVLANAVEPHLDASFFYLTGFPYGLFEVSALLCTRESEFSLFTTPLEEEIARANTKGIKIFADADQDKRFSELRKKAKRIRSVGINAGELTVKSYEILKSVFKASRIVDVSDAFESARLVKDSGEVEAIQEACDIASGTFKKIPSILRQNISESEVAAEIAFEMQKAGGSGVSFDSIVAFGKNSAEPHYSAGSGKLKKGQFALFDYGTRYLRYCSDITRTVVFGRASKEQRNMYEMVFRALELAKELCVPSSTGAEVHSKVAGLINSTKYKGRFIHSTGHSLGLNVHDGPGLSRSFAKNLIPGMVVTVEPGVYIPGFGGVRIEDDVLITKNKPRILTTATRELIEA